MIESEKKTREGVEFGERTRRGREKEKSGKNEKEGRKEHRTISMNHRKTFSPEKLTESRSMNA